MGRGGIISSVALSELESGLEFWPNEELDEDEDDWLGSDMSPSGIPPDWLFDPELLEEKLDGIPDPELAAGVASASFSARLGLTSELSPLRARARLASSCEYGPPG